MKRRDVASRQPRVGPRSRGSRRSGGSVFVLVLAVTALVSIIGLSAMTSIRLQHRGAQARTEAAQAQRLADAMLEVMHARLSANAGWRTAYPHNTWSSAEAVGVGAFQFKLVDELDGNLTDDAEEPVRLYVRATHRAAVRLVSVELRPGVTLGPELLINADMEGGASGFFTDRGGNLAVHSDSPRGGMTYLQHEGGSPQRSLRQSVLNKVTAGKTYRITGWVRAEGSATTAKLGIFYALLLVSGDYAFTAPVGTSWTYVKGDVNADLTLLPTTLDFYVNTTATNQDLHVDDLSVRELLSTALPVVRGSYRQEVE